MYDSPIKVFEQIPNIISEINNQKENLVYEAVTKVGVDVDKNELLKALQYDREQYSKGYSDGKSDGAREFAEWCEEKGYFDDYHAPFLKDMLAEWQKEQKNDIKRNNQETNSSRDV